MVIPTRDRRDDLARCLESVLASDHDSFEIIVVDQGVPAASVPCDERVVHIPTGTRGKSAALNVGIAAARRTCWPSPMTTAPCPETGSTASRSSSGNTRISRWRSVSSARLRTTLVQLFVPAWTIDEFEIVHAVRRGQIRGGAGANMAARRSTFEAIGLWDEEIGPGSRFRSCEEGDIIFRALTTGQAVARVPDLAVTHWGGRAWADGSGRDLMRGYAYGTGALVGKHLRLGDRHMVPVAARHLAEDLWLVASGLAHLRRLGDRSARLQVPGPG